jgi:hypothetical protein
MIMTRYAQKVSEPVRNTEKNQMILTMAGSTSK